jgi:membrane protease YdiL (CAAX protease family)
VLAAVVSSLLFAGLHMEPVILPALFLLAFVLCAVYARTGSLLPPLVAHATFNSFTVIMILLGGAAVPPA